MTQRSVKKEVGETPYRYRDHESVLIVPWISSMELGVGYDLSQESIKSSPSAVHRSELVLAPPAATGQSGLLEMDRVENTDELIEHIQATANPSLSFGPFSAGASGKFVRESKVNSYGLSFLVRSIATNPARQLDGFRLSKEAQDLLVDSKAFRRAYGDSYVHGMITGASLVALLSLRTDSRTVEEQIKVDLDGSGIGEVKFSAELTSEIQRASTHKGVHLSVLVHEGGWDGEVVKSDSAEDLYQQAQRIPEIAKSGGEPMFAIVKPYALLPECAESEPSLDVQALAARRSILTHVYARAKTSIEAVEFALDHPSQFRESEANLESLQDQLNDVVQQLHVAWDALADDPTATISVPELPDRSLIPARLWGGDRVALAPPRPLTPAIQSSRFEPTLHDVRRFLGESERVALTAAGLVTETRKDLVEVFGRAISFLSAFPNLVDAMDEAPGDRREIMSRLAAMVDAGISESEAFGKQIEARFNLHDTILQKVERVNELKKALIDPEDISFGGLAFWKQLQVDLIDPLNRLIQGSKTSLSGEDQVADAVLLSRDAWRAAVERFEGGLKAFYSSIYGTDVSQFEGVE